MLTPPACRSMPHRAPAAGALCLYIFGSPGLSDAIFAMRQPMAPRAAVLHQRALLCTFSRVPSPRWPWAGWRDDRVRYLCEGTLDFRNLLSFRTAVGRSKWVRTHTPRACGTPSKKPNWLCLHCHHERKYAWRL